MAKSVAQDENDNNTCYEFTCQKYGFIKVMLWLRAPQIFDSLVPLTCTHSARGYSISPASEHCRIGWDG